MADSFTATRYLFYMPAIVLLPLGLLLALFGGGTRKARLARCIAIAIPGLIALHGDQPLLLQGPQTSGPAVPDFSVMTYNVMAYALGDSGIQDTIERANPDVLVLVEGTFLKTPPAGLSKSMGKDYQWAVGKRLSVASRFPVLESTVLETPRGMAALRVVLDIREKRVTILAIDINPPMRRADSEVFDELYALVRLEEGTLIVCGDFNAPRHSRHLSKAVAPLQDDMLAASAHRYLGTWPSWVPLWQIDHSFSSMDMRPTNAQIISTNASDHRPILVEYRLPTGE